MQKGEQQLALSELCAAPASGRWKHAAVAIVLMGAVVFCFTQEQDYDAYWHLASGEWMMQNHRLLDHDPFTSMPENPGGTWVNVYWLFQLIVAGVHSIGGFEALTVFKALVFAGGVWVAARSLLRSAPAGWVIVSMMLTVLASADRVRVRPEMFTLPMLMVTVSLVDDVRRGLSPRRLWWLVPMMTAWVNMHGLFFLGLMIMWLGMLGTAIDRLAGRGGAAGGLWSSHALAPLLAATAACLVSPWPIEAFLHPLTLATRIDATGDYYIYGVSELQRTWSAFSGHIPALVLVLMAIGAMLINARRIPAAHWLWSAAMIGIALLARRNVALAAVPVGYLLAFHGGRLIGSLKTAPIVRRVFTYAAACAAICLIVLCASENLYRMQGSSQRFVAGIDAAKYPSAIATWLGQSQLEGDVLSLGFGDASTFIYYSYPARKVWMDGRLEIHSTERFRQLQEMNNSFRGGDLLRHDSLAARPPAAVRFIYAGKDRHQALTALMHSPRHRLIRVDPAGACFAYLGWGGDDGAPLPDGPNLDDFDSPLTPRGLRNPPAPARRWWRANPQCPYHQIGQMLLSLGKFDPDAGDASPAWTSPAELRAVRQKSTVLAVRYLEAAARAGLSDPQALKASLGEAWMQYSFSQRDKDAPGFDPAAARAMFLAREIDLSKLDDQHVWPVGLLQIQTMIQANQLQTALDTLDSLRAHLPGPQKVKPTNDYIRMRAALADSIELKKAQARQMLEGVEDPVARSKQYGALGLDALAVAELEAAPRNRQVSQALLDALAATGRLSDARCLLDQDDRVRVAGLAWAQGRLEEAHATLDAEGRPLGDIGESLGRILGK